MRDSTRLIQALHVGASCQVFALSLSSPAILIVRPLARSLSSADMKKIKD